MEVVKFQEFGLDEKKANEITKDLPAIIKERDVLSAQYQEVIKMDIDDPATGKKAGELRKLIKNNRTRGVEAWHKANKEYFLRGGQFVDAVKNKEIAENKRMEDALEEIEKHQERLEAKRKKELNEKRIQLVSSYLEDTTGLNLSDMEEDVWEAYLSAKRKAYEDKIEAERKAEEERLESERKAKLRNDRILKTSRLADFIPNYDSVLWEDLTDEEFDSLAKSAIEKRTEHEAEQERIRVENEKLKAEAEAKIAKEKAEREAREAKEKEEARLRKIEDDKKQAEIDRVKAELESEKKKEQERIHQESIAREAKEKAERELAKAGDMKRIKHWIDSMTISGIGTEGMKPESVDLCNDIISKFESFKKWANSQVK